MNKMLETTKIGTSWWTDSCDVNELKEAVKFGATGATSNPVIVYNVIKNNPDAWNPVLKSIINDHPKSSEDEIAWMLVETVGRDASKVLLPEFERSGGKGGRLSIQVNPKFYKNTTKMVEHGKHLSTIAPNIAIKAPSTKEGIKAFEKLTSEGICVNATVSFSLSQVLASAEAIERGLEKAKKNGVDTDNFTPYITIMVGRIDDQLRREMDSKDLAIDPNITHWGGVAVFKKAYQIFKERGYSSKLLSAAYRNPMQWSELNGPDVHMTIPYKWWNRFNKSDVAVKSKINESVNDQILDDLKRYFSDFSKVYNENGISLNEIESYGACQYTLNQFLNGYDLLVQYVRKQMIYR